MIIFVAAQQGGNLLLRHSDRKWTFDFSKDLIGSLGQPNIAFIAFRNGVEYDVSPVIAGHLVTFTYHLHRRSVHRHADPHLKLKSQRSGDIERMLRELLNDTSFLPDGGRLGFGLSSQYPFFWEAGEPCDAQFEALKHGLKGRDAVVFQVCEALGLIPSFKFYIGQWNNSGTLDEDFLGDEMIDLVDSRVDDIDECLRANGAELLTSRVTYAPCETIFPVEWITVPNSLNRGMSAHTLDGYADYLHGNVCMVIPIGDLESRGLLSGS
jgi:hypothetical protein